MRRVFRHFADAVIVASFLVLAFVAGAGLLTLYWLVTSP